MLFTLQHSEDGNGRRMPHEYILLDYGAGESGAVFIGPVEVVEIDGKFLARAFPHTDNHLGCQSELHVIDSHGGRYLRHLF